MEQNTTAGPSLRDVYDRLGSRNQSVKDTLDLLKTKGIKASRSAVYQTVEGRSQRREIVEAFLEVAEAEFTRRRQVEERTRQLVAEA